MSLALKLPLTKKTFISTSSHRSKVELHSDHLMFVWMKNLVEERFIIKRFMRLKWSGLITSFIC